MKHFIQYLRVKSGLSLFDTLVALSIGACIAIIIYILLATISPLPSAGEVASHAIKQRMAYHGTETAFQGHDGKVYFYRDGERCEL